MHTLVCLGYGYSARHYVAGFGSRWRRIIGTVRQQPPEADRYLTLLSFDGATATPALRETLREADALLVSIPPAGARDPCLTALVDILPTCSKLRTVVYLSTVGVYGDHDGGWVDEATPPAPVTARSRARVEAEQAWQTFGAGQHVPVALLRLAGIYGPGQNALVTISDGKARRVIKPGQVFNRIHVADIAQAIDAAFAHRADGPFNVCDDEPAPPQDVTAYAAQLMNRAPPPEIDFAVAQATMSPMSLSFYGENKRVRNARMKTELGIALRYPTYREGLTALWAEARAEFTPDAGK